MYIVIVLESHTREIETASYAYDFMPRSKQRKRLLVVLQIMTSNQYENPMNYHVCI